jgi:hypothetical protein
MYQKPLYQDPLYQTRQTLTPSLPSGTRPRSGRIGPEWNPGG